MTPYLSIEELSVSYGGTRVLDRVSLDVERGEMIALLGSSGCGKTTLLRSIAGFVMPDDGHASASTGATSRACRPKSARRAMMFQSYALWPHMTRRRQHRLRPARCAAGRATRSPSASAEMLKLLQLEGFDAAAGDAAVRRPAAARRARPRAGGRSAPAAARRADVEPRLQGAPRAAPRAARAAAAHRHHRRLRHARSRGGADARRPHRGDRRRAHRRRSARRRRSSTGRRARSSPASWAPTTRSTSSQRAGGALARGGRRARRRRAAARAFSQRRGDARRAASGHARRRAGAAGRRRAIGVRRPRLSLSRAHRRRRGLGHAPGAHRGRTAATVVVPREALLLFPRSTSPRRIAMQVPQAASHCAPLAAALAVSGAVTAQTTLNVVTAGDQNMVDYVNNYLGAEVRGDESGREGARRRHRPGRCRLAEDLREALGAAEGRHRRRGTSTSPSSTSAARRRWSRRTC